MKNISRIEKRIKIINYIYQFELMNTNLKSDLAFESGNFTDKEIKIIDNISNNYIIFKKNINKFLSKTWKWDRLPPLIRSILIYASFEFHVSDKALVIEQMILITKAYSPDESYKFVNAILDNIGDFYEKKNK